VVSLPMRFGGVTGGAKLDRKRRAGLTWPRPCYIGPLNSHVTWLSSSWEQDLLSDLPRSVFSALHHARRIPAVLVLSAGLSACAQSGALFNGPTGAISPATQSAPNADTAGMPPVPGRRSAKAGSGADSSTGFFGALPDIDLSSPAVAPASVVAQDTPTNVYVRLARGIRRCWLGPDNPKLAGHGFRASAQPGRSGKAEIDIYKQVEGRKLGPFAFEIRIAPEGSGALVRSTNRRLDDKRVNELRADIARWTRGGKGCVSARAKKT